MDKVPHTLRQQTSFYTTFPLNHKHDFTWNTIPQNTKKTIIKILFCPGNQVVEWTSPGWTPMWFQLNLANSTCFKMNKMLSINRVFTEMYFLLDFLVLLQLWWVTANVSIKSDVLFVSCIKPSSHGYKNYIALRWGYFHDFYLTFSLKLLYVRFWIVPFLLEKCYCKLLAEEHFITCATLFTMQINHTATSAKALDMQREFRSATHNAE